MCVIISLSDVDPVLVYCWPIVYDIGPAFTQHWDNLRYFHDDYTYYSTLTE